MKKLFLLALAICAVELTSLAQTNTFPTTGNAGINTLSPGAALDMVAPAANNGAQLKLRGADASWQNADILITRGSSGTDAGRGPNIKLADATSSAVIQSSLGRLLFYPGGWHPAGVTMTSDGLGVKTIAPLSAFQVNNNFEKLSIGSANTTSLLGSSYIGFNAARTSANVWRFDHNVTANGGAVMYGDLNGTINFATVPTQNGGGNYFTLTDAQLKNYVAFQVTSGGVTRAKRLKVETTGWPDYVFSKEYKLPSLSSVNAYIQKNRHLPDMPSAKEVHADGQDVGEINKLLLKKVEELTLYLIEKDGQFNKLKKEQQAQQEKNDQQQALLEELKSAVSVLKAQQKK